MNWNKEILTKIKFDNISNLEEKTKVAEKVAENVKDGQVIRLWLWFYILFSNNSNS